jgi:hypothetical protein
MSTNERTSSQGNSRGNTAREIKEDIQAHPLAKITIKLDKANIQAHPLTQVTIDPDQTNKANIQAHPLAKITIKLDKANIQAHPLTQVTIDPDQTNKANIQAHPLTQITIDPDQADLFGTTRLEYKLWVDYIFDWFGATLEKRFRRYLVGIGFATIVWGLGFILSLTIGFANDYLRTPAIYYFLIGIAWCTNALRWLSQVYHVRTNAVRPCFPIDDVTYKSTVSPFAHNAVRNKRLFFRSTLFTIIVLIYFGLIMLGYIKSLSFLALGFPSSFPTYWLVGNFLLVKLAIIALFLWVAFVEVWTGAQLTLSTAPLYAKLATLPILPLPSLVSELFQGILDLYLTGAIMWSLGIVLVELLYRTRATVLGIGFLIVVIGLGVFAYLVPRAAVRKIWTHAKHQAITDTMFDFYANNVLHNSAKLKEINEYIQSLGNSEPGIDIVQFTGFVVGQLLPILPLIANTSLIRFIGL